MSAERVEPVFTVTRSTPGYAHTKIEGTYTGDATEKDVKAKFYSPYFGGREARAWGGKFSCVRHDD